ncbi:response regulator transcription factor [bacterium]|nr:response regulator transcription factor [bacterium]
MITLCIASAVSLYREGLLRALNQERGILVTSTAAKAEEVIRSCHGAHPEILLLDLALPGQSTAALLRRLKQRGCLCIVLLFGALTPEGAEQASRQRHRGLLCIEDDVEEYVRAVHRCSAGEYFLSVCAEQLLEGDSFTVAPHIESILTATELQILRAIAENRTSREIADAMYISYRTVQKHRSNMVRKLRLQGRNALLTFAMGQARKEH